MADEQPSLHIDTDWKKQAQEEKRKLAEQEQKRNAEKEAAAKTATLPLTNPGSRAFQRHIFGGAAEVELDRQGRVVLPAYLREYAALTGDVVILGARDHVEIWAPSRWDDVRRSLEDPETLAAHLDGLGI